MTRRPREVSTWKDWRQAGMKSTCQNFWRAAQFNASALSPLFACQYLSIILLVTMLHPNIHNKDTYYSLSRHPLFTIHIATFKLSHQLPSQNKEIFPFILNSLIFSTIHILWKECCFLYGSHTGTLLLLRCCVSSVLQTVWTQLCVWPQPCPHAPSWNTYMTSCHRRSQGQSMVVVE